MEKVEEIRGVKPEKTNVTTGKGCVECCRQGSLRLEATIRDWISQILTLMASPPETRTSYAENPYGIDLGVNYSTEAPTVFGFLERPEITTLKPPQGPQVGIPSAPKIVIKPSFEVPKISDTGAGRVGGTAAIVLLLGEAYILNVGREIVIKIMEGLDQLLTLDRTTNREVFDCEECCRKRLLSQNNPRQIVTEKIKKRVQ